MFIFSFLSSLKYIIKKISLRISISSSSARKMWKKKEKEFSILKRNRAKRGKTRMVGADWIFLHLTMKVKSFYCVALNSLLNITRSISFFCENSTCRSWEMRKNCKCSNTWRYTFWLDKRKQRFWWNINIWLDLTGIFFFRSIHQFRFSCRVAAYLIAEASIEN